MRARQGFPKGRRRNEVKYEGAVITQDTRQALPKGDNFIGIFFAGWRQGFHPSALLLIARTEARRYGDRLLRMGRGRGDEIENGLMGVLTQRRGDEEEQG